MCHTLCDTFYNAYVRRERFYLHPSWKGLLLSEID